MNENEEFEFALAREKERPPTSTPPDAGEKIKTGINDFGSGAMEGATFGTRTIDTGGNIVAPQAEPKGIPGSVMTEAGTAKKPGFTGSTKDAGKLFGGMIPLAVAELASGAAAPYLVMKYGMGPVKAAMNQMGLTMAGYAGLKGAAQSKPPLETAGDMAGGYIAGLPLGAAGYAANKGVNWLTSQAPEGLANQYLNTPPKIADSLMDKGKPSLGRQYLDKTSYGAGTSKEAQYKDILGKLEDNRMLIKNKLEQADTAALESASKLPAQPEPTFNQYKYPNQVRQGTPVTETYERDALGAPVLKKSEPDTLGYRYRKGGSPMSGEYAQPHGTYEPDALGASSKVSNLTTGRGGGINLDEVRGASQAVGREQSDIGKGMADITLGEPGERVVSNARAFDLLTKLDAEVNTAHQAVDKNTIPPGTEARAAMANRLREMLRQSVPEVSELLGQNHSLQLFETSLLPQVSGRAPISRGGDWMKGAAAKTLGSSAGLGTARLLESQPVDAVVQNVAKPAAKAGAQLGLAELIDRRTNARKR